MFTRMARRSRYVWPLILLSTAALGWIVYERSRPAPEPPGPTEVAAPPAPVADVATRKEPAAAAPSKPEAVEQKVATAEPEAEPSERPEPVAVATPKEAQPPVPQAPVQATEAAPAEPEPASAQSAEVAHEPAPAATVVAREGVEAELPAATLTPVPAPAATEPVPEAPATAAAEPVAPAPPAPVAEVPEPKELAAIEPAASPKTGPSEAEEITTEATEVEAPPAEAPAAPPVAAVVETPSVSPPSPLREPDQPPVAAIAPPVAEQEDAAAITETARQPLPTPPATAGAPEPSAGPVEEPALAETKPAPEKAEPAESDTKSAPEEAEPAESKSIPSLVADTIRRALQAMLGGSEEVAPEEEKVAEEPPAPAEADVDESQQVARARPDEEAAAAQPEPMRPSFDIVRIEPGGQAVIAGRAEPGAEVELRVGERVIERTRANRAGEWVATPMQPLPPGDLELSVIAIGRDGRPVESEEIVVVVVPEPPPPPRAVAGSEPPPPQPPPVAEGEAPPPQPAEVAAAAAPAEPVAVLLPKEGGGRILQAPGRISSDGSLALMMVDYDDAGRIRLSGEAPPGAPVRVYVDNQPAAEVVVQPSGQWTTLLDRRLPPGNYTLRLDQLGPGGKPVARLETPFTRVSRPPIAGKAQVDYVVVQPGNSLWRISRRLFGRGIRYVHIYEANKAQIRDPDLIYPGQVFKIPPGIENAG